MESRAQSNKERVRANTPHSKNAKVDQKIRNNIDYYRNLPACVIHCIKQHNSWDIFE